MGKIRTYFLCAIFCFSFLGLVSAGTVILKSGLKVEGKIIEQTNTYVKLDFQGVELTFFNEEIFSIDQTSEGADTASSQIELLYKAYSASLNSDKSQTKEEAKEEAVGDEVKNDSGELDKEAIQSLLKLSSTVKDKKPR